MISSSLQWLSLPETWFKLILFPIISWALKVIYGFCRKKLVSLRDSVKEKNRSLIAEYASDDILTFKIVASREVWLAIFIIGGFSWFVFVMITPLRALTEMGPAVFGLSMAPAWILEILFLSRDSLAKDVLRERKKKRSQPATTTDS